jgi:SPX domain protein involved in polyphosphate accumulation
MRFGRTLEKSIYQPWRDNYIDYAKLKKLLREDDSASNSPNRQTSDRWTEDGERAAGAGPRLP